MLTCQQLADRLMAAAVRARNELDVPTEALMFSLKGEAKAKIGHYQTAWAPLRPSTVAEKTRLGFSPPDNPLLRTGELRDSIFAAAELYPGGATGVVASDDEIAAYQELGTRTIPPRPFLGTAMATSYLMAEKIFGEFAVNVLSGSRFGGLPLSYERG